MEQVDLIKERIRLTRALMEHPAWPLLVRDWQEEVEALKHQLVYSVNTEGLQGVYRGKLDVLERLVNLGKLLDAVEAGLEEAEESDE